MTRDTSLSEVSNRPGPQQVLGAVLIPALAAAIGLGIASAAPDGGLVFYVATFAVAAVYFITWALCPRSHPAFLAQRAGKDALRGLGIGMGLLLIFLAGAFLVRYIPVLAGPVDALLDNARYGLLWVTILTTAINGVGEEVFFRRIAMDYLPGTWRTRALISLVLYIAVTAAMGVPLLALAAIAVGVPAALEARRTGSLVSACVLHISWSLGMLLILPHLI
ncbi:CPBP family intramembrane glutamic endopeptidase [Rothia amarae]|uniref:CPBP family intramembrane glutamic endopeptidase n=1 Tax=Rothia amarae TaxID=169480 RepID=UPI003410E92D